MKLTQRDSSQTTLYEHNEELNAKRVEIVGGGNIQMSATIDNSDVIEALKDTKDSIVSAINNTLNELSENLKLPLSVPLENVNIPKESCSDCSCGSVETKFERIEIPVIVKETVIQVVEIPKIIIEKEIIQGRTDIVETTKEILPSWVKMVVVSQLIIIMACIAAIIFK